VRKQPVRKIPFSPVKTRFKNVYSVRDSDDEGAISESVIDEPAPTRRSTRVRKTKQLDAEYIDGEESDDFEESPRDVPKRKARPKAKLIRRAAYGRIRAVVDLSYDSQSDEETAPLREHRGICEKCHQKPAHKLLEAQRKKKKSHKKKVVDEFEEDESEEEKLTALGGWVRW
jgi:chromodomain-helicase-DNA-binding protein 4